MIVLSHGDEDLLYASDRPYPPEEIIDPFTADKCPTLAGKVLLFIVWQES